MTVRISVILRAARPCWATNALARGPDTQATNACAPSLVPRRFHEYYTAKSMTCSIKVVENRMQQCCAAHIVHSCQQYCSALLHVIAGWFRLNNAEQYCWQLWTMWAAQHCCILFSTTLNKSSFLGVYFKYGEISERAEVLQVQSRTPSPRSSGEESRALG